jgi:hypothetical protein
MTRKLDMSRSEDFKRDEHTSILDQLLKMALFYRTFSNSVFHKLTTYLIWNNFETVASAINFSGNASMPLSSDIM